ncbi:leucine-rich repeat protein [Dethiobacter alkaliphilus]|uniref:leucine-rich repeat protein n=1 Tax=Dethiobacter alkaliphilus TaxID=427926 RepID=UPI002226F70F|nr:leucine-rich repeat protein [Dethiobacter alkaliphilus]MCW3490309.1 leucine-rich repeat protein [Dethiobacter alkaliphilus]
MIIKHSKVFPIIVLLVVFALVFSYIVDVVDTAVVYAVGNNAPIAHSASFTVAEGGTYNGIVSGEDPDDDPISFSLTTGPSRGTLIFNSDGSFSYTAHRQPTVGFVGVDSFSFVANDGVASSEPAVVNITITPVNDPPETTPKAFTVTAGETYSGAVSGTDIDGDVLTFALVTTPTQGTLNLNPDGTFDYTAFAGATGSDSFTFRANDGSADSNISTVSITIEPAGDYDYTVDNGEATIVKYIGDSSDVVIPDTLGGYPVTAIGEMAFLMNDPRITSVTIPDSVTVIERRAFGSNRLTTLTIPDSVVIIGNDAFVYNDLTSLSIGSSVESIGNYAFRGNDLTSVTIPGNVISIGRDAFDSNQLTSVTIGNGVETIGNSAFTHNQITSVTIPDSVITIGDDAFEENQLTSVTLGDGLISIGRYAFSDNQISSLTIGNSVESIGDHAFRRNVLTEIVIPDNVVTIGSYAFRENQINLLTIGTGVESIGNYAFRDNELTELIIPDNVTSIGRYAFMENSLAEITFGSGLESIDRETFRDNQLTSLTIPENITSLGWSAFRDNQLTSVTLPPTMTSIGNWAFQNNQLSSIIIPESVTSIGSSVFIDNQAAPEDLTIYGKTGSEAETYATNNDHTFVNYYLSVIFKDYDGSTLKEELVIYGNDATAPSEPTREGYTFTGWDLDYTNITEDLEVTALYSLNSYQATFRDYDGSLLNEETVSHGNDATAPSEPTREGYTFTGWDSDYTSITEDLEVTALYSLNSYQATFRDYDGSLLKEETVSHGNDATAPSEPTREGYTFTGWDSDYTSITEDLEITALYKINQYTINFNSSGGSPVEAIYADYGTTITAPVTPIREGYNFAGWYKGETLTDTWDFATETVPAKNTTLYAKWTLVKIKAPTVIYQPHDSSSGITISGLEDKVNIPEKDEEGVEEVTLILKVDSAEEDESYSTVLSSAKEALEGEGYKLLNTFDIYILKRVQKDDGSISEIRLLNSDITSPLTVRIPIPEKLSDKTDLAVVYIDDNGNVDILNTEWVTVDNVDYLEFETDHFSLYGFIERLSAPVETVEEAESESTEGELPKTGGAGPWGLGLILLAGGIALLRRK